MLSLRPLLGARVLLRRLTEGAPPEAPRRHGLTLREDGALLVTLAVRGAFQTYILDEEDLHKEPEVLAEELLAMDRQVAASMANLTGGETLGPGEIHELATQMASIAASESLPPGVTPGQPLTDALDRMDAVDPPGAPVLAQYPHCDSGVLHLPGTCEFCDMAKFQVLHDWRAANGINHTGENDPAKKRCPAEARRPLERIHDWGGNRPSVGHGG